MKTGTGSLNFHDVGLHDIGPLAARWREFGFFRSCEALAWANPVPASVDDRALFEIPCYARESPSRGWPERRPSGPLHSHHNLSGRDVALKCALALLMTGVGGVAVFFAFALVSGL